MGRAAAPSGTEHDGMVGTLHENCGFSCDQSGCGIGHDDMLGVLAVTN